MTYTVTWLPKYASKVPGKYDNWKNLNAPSIDIPVQYKLMVRNYQIKYL